MTLRSAWPRFSAALVATVAVYASGGCSFFYDLNTTQCEVTGDCQAFGSQFANTTCVNRVCVEKGGGETGGMTSSGGTDGGGSNGKGGSGTGGKGSGGSGASETGGSETGGSETGGEGNGADAGMGGEGGTGSPPECSTNADCIDANLDRPFICRNEKCVSLITDECPVLLPTAGNLEILRDKVPPVVLGGYASMTNKMDLKDTLAVINWDLAFDEFATAQEVGSKQPRMVGLVCQGLAAEFDVEASMKHLTQEVGTPGIVSTLASDDLDAAWQFTQTSEYTAAGGKPVFFMSTGTADLRLANLEDNGLVWHQLGDPRGLAATMAALVKRIEPRANAARQAYYDTHAGTPGLEQPTVPLRVTLIYVDDPTMIDVAKVLTTPDSMHPENTLKFNGQTAIHSGTGHPKATPWPSGRRRLTALAKRERFRISRALVSYC